MAQIHVSPKIIIVPSPLIRAETYFKLREHLQRYGKVGVLELPETGNYGSMKKVWYPEDYARWISSFISERHFENLILLGHSNSGPIVTKVASLIPERIRGIILADSIGCEDQKPLKVLKGRFRDAFQEFKFSVRAFPHLMKNALAHPRNFFLQVALSHQDMSECLFPNEIKHPVFLGWGERDRTMPVSFAHQIKEKFPKVDVHISPTGSHDWILTNPKEFSDSLEFWMTKLDLQEQEKKRMAEARTNFERLDPAPPPS